MSKYLKEARDLKYICCRVDQMNFSMKRSERSWKCKSLCCSYSSVASE